MFTPSATSGSRMIEGGQQQSQHGQQGQQSQQGQVQKGQGQQQGQGQIAARDTWRNRMLAGRGFKVDVSETDKSYIVRADLPGVDKKDVKIEIDDSHELLTISAEKKEEKKEDTETRHVVERSWGSFTRTFRLPDDVNVDECKTGFNNGVLELTFTKMPEKKKAPKRG